MSELLDNNSVAAFIGAFSAFLLVMFTDRLRRGRTRNLLRVLVADNLDHARHKIETVRTGIALLREDNKISDAPVMRFPTKSIQEIQHQVLDLLSANENQATHAILYWMEAIDDLIAEGVRTAAALKESIRNKSGLQERTTLGDKYLETMAEAERNLGLLAGMCESYVKGKYHEIIEFSHPIGNSK